MLQFTSLFLFVFRCTLILRLSEKERRLAHGRQKIRVAASGKIALHERFKAPL